MNNENNKNKEDKKSINKDVLLICDLCEMQCEKKFGKVHLQ